MSTIAQKLAEAGKHVVSLLAERDAPACTNVSRAEAQAALSAQVDSWHERAAERISNDLQRLAAGQSIDMMAPADTFGYQMSADVLLKEHAEDVRAYLTFGIGKAAMLKRFAPLIEQMPEGLDASARTAHLADIEAQIVQAEVLEESLIREAEAEGIEIDPRPGQRAEAAILIGFGEL
ncbi:hypothetical protein J7E70_30245 [Variovorax paradoxus]|nr:hypothetical protein [Variovorax paradoxus]MBT2304703.1 hypothetical protein [Variovorax paradoxus]